MDPEPVRRARGLYVALRTPRAHARSRALLCGGRAANIRSAGAAFPSAS